MPALPMPPSTMTTCDICYNDYTAIQRRPVTCHACAFTACTTCIKTYLLSAAVAPHCMNCRQAWGRPFLDSHLSHSWCQGELRKHREAVLFDRERSLLPATQEAVAVERQKRAFGTELPTLFEQLDALERQMDIVRDQIREYQHFIRHGPRTTPAAQQERRQFIAACPKADCRGFLSTAYKCGTCAGQFCADCRELKEEGHTCNPDLVATIREIQRDSRPCPNCGTAISRVSGCDQMYCTQCNTAYSYATGKVVTGVIHNPHYFERMRALGGEAPRQPGDNPCGGWPRWYDFNAKIPTRFNVFVRDIYQNSRHVEHEELPRYPLETDRVDNTDLRVRYLLGELTEKALRQQAQQRDRRNQFRMEVRGPLELFVVSSLELMQHIARSRTAVTEERIDEYRNLIETTVNEPLRVIADRYKLRVPQFAMDVQHRGPRMTDYRPNKKKSASNAATTSEESDDSDESEGLVRHIRT
jgi:hypothetical protein